MHIRLILEDLSYAVDRQQAEQPSHDHNLLEANRHLISIACSRSYIDIEKVHVRSTDCCSSMATFKLVVCTILDCQFRKHAAQKLELLRFLHLHLHNRGAYIIAIPFLARMLLFAVGNCWATAAALPLSLAAVYISWNSLLAVRRF